MYTTTEQWATIKVAWQLPPSLHQSTNQQIFYIIIERSSVKMFLVNGILILVAVWLGGTMSAPGDFEHVSGMFLACQLSSCTVALIDELCLNRTILMFKPRYT